MKSITIHPAADIFPLLEGEAFDQLVADIRENGQHESCVFYQGQLLDGRNRWRACEVLGIEPEECWLENDPSTFDPVAWVLSANLHRRHLTPSQRAMVAVKVKQYHAKAARERQMATLKQNASVEAVQVNLPERKTNGQSRDLAGAALKVSGRSVDHAAVVMAKGSPELVEAVQSGKVSVSRAAKEVSKPTTVDKQRALYDRTPKKLSVVEQLVKLWDKATKSERQSFLRYIGRS